jgi:hypothetical protein
MSSQTPLEARVGELISRYADRAPTLVDPTAMTVAAAGGSARRQPHVWQLTWSQRRLALTMLIVALLAAIAAGSLMAGAEILRRDPVSVLARSAEIHVGWVFVYSDGRVLIYPDMDPVLERHLTDEGVELVRNGSVDPADFLGRGRPVTHPGIWVETEFSVYQPSRIAVCYWMMGELADATRVVELMPAPAQDILEGRERAYDLKESPIADLSSVECSELTPSERPALDEALDQIGRRDEGGGWIVVSKTDGSRDPIEIGVFTVPILPHGTWMAWGG